MKWKPSGPRDGWKYAASNTPRSHLEAITFHKNDGDYYVADDGYFNHQRSGGSESPTLDILLLARLVPLDTIEKICSIT